MSTTLKLTPAELKAQSAEMSALNREMGALFSRINAEMTSANGSWSANLSNNFASKLKSVNSSFKELSDLFTVGANAAMTSAESMETVDTELAKLMHGGHNDRADSYNAGGGGYSSGGGGKGSFGGRDSDSRGEGKQGFWADQWEQLKDGWNTLGEGWNWLDNKLPDWAKKDLKKLVESVFGGDMNVALSIFGDLINNDLSLDTLKTYLDACNASVSDLGFSAFRILTNAIINPSERIQYLKDNGEFYSDLAIDAFVNGDILEGLYQSGMTILYYTSETVTEITSGVINSASGVVTSVGDAIGRIIPGEVGDYIVNVAEGVESTAKKVVNWISGLF